MKEVMHRQRPEMSSTICLCYLIRFQKRLKVLRLINFQRVKNKKKKSKLGPSVAEHFFSLKISPKKIPRSRSFLRVRSARTGSEKRGSEIACGTAWVKGARIERSFNLKARSPTRYPRWLEECPLSGKGGLTTLMTSLHLQPMTIRCVAIHGIHITELPYTSICMWEQALLHRGLCIAVQGAISDCGAREISGCRGCNP